MRLELKLNTMELPSDRMIPERGRDVYKDLLLGHFFTIEISIDGVNIKDGICLAGINAWDAIEKLMKKRPLEETPIFSGTNYDVFIEKSTNSTVTIKVINDENTTLFNVDRTVLIRELSTFLVELYSSCIKKCPKSLKASGLYDTFKSRLDRLSQIVKDYGN